MSTLELVEPAAVDLGETWGVRLFLRRYVTWGARSREVDMELAVTDGTEEPTQTALQIDLIVMRCS